MGRGLERRDDCRWHGRVGKTPRNGKTETAELLRDLEEEDGGDICWVLLECQVVRDDKHSNNSGEEASL